MNYYDRGQPYHCLLKTERPGISCSMCEKYQCQMCFDYQAGLTKPAYPVPAIINRIVYYHNAIVLETKSQGLWFGMKQLA